MSITATLFRLAVDIVEKIGYLGVFVLMTLESALIPIPSEAVMPFAGFLASQGKMDLWVATLMGTLGNLLGSVLTYYLGAKYGREFLLRYGKYLLISKHHVTYIENLFSKHGSLIILAGRMMPAVRTVISFPAGVARMNFYIFALLTFLGSIPWNLALTYVGLILGENWAIVEEYMIYVDIVVVIALIICIAIFYLKLRESLAK